MAGLDSAGRVLEPMRSWHYHVPSLRLGQVSLLGTSKKFRVLSLLHNAS